MSFSQVEFSNVMSMRVPADRTGRIALMGPQALLAHQQKCTQEALASAASAASEAEICPTPQYAGSVVLGQNAVELDPAA